MAEPWPVDPNAPNPKPIRRLDILKFALRLNPKARLSDLSDALFEQGFHAIFVDEKRDA